ncbi:cation diffusion facilitator family transporter [Acuticoccus sp. MNP-M23]|uniref:cation diffusion facilitator family transporter n=1 Tax=Acuticoccus sp. MNP-M23 TaxID=3072793 RepID=UPI0028166C3C|nr:cation diffusion facilitator family transporter [Acuticoccus sp. MNP-M23]WMS42018.1 cation diffusion facilitator family transporter [Acuticoccus sp. MNP-M23]
MAAKGNKTIIYAALGANAAIAVTKFVASAITGSSAMFAEAIHSLVDTGNQGLLLFGLRQAKRPASPEHPFGHGKDLYFYSFMVAIIIFGAGAGFAAFEGIEKLLHPGAVEVSWINYAVLGAAFLFELFAWSLALKEFNKVRGDRGVLETVRRSKDPTLFTVLFEDTAAMVGLIVAFIGILAANITGNPLYDALGTLAIAAVLALTAVFLAIETKGLLVGEAADPKLVAELRALVQAEPAIETVNELLTMHFGPHEILVTVSADFRNDLTAEEVEDVVAALDTKIKAAAPDVRRLFVQAMDRADHRRARLAQAADA